MKKRYLLCTILSLILIFGSSFPTFATEEGAASEETVTETEAETEPETLENGEPRLDSASCCVMDQKTGLVLYEKDMDAKHYPASITKILTSLVFLEHIQSLDEVVTFSEDCWEGIDHYDNMNIDMRDGEKLTAEQCLYAMLLASANEVCNQVAIYTAGSVPAFAEMMNERAAQLGCTGSHFVNPNGLHDKDHYLTAHDMALISREALNNETFRKITATPVYTIESTNMREEPIEIGSKHLILRESRVHDDACVGGKTGWTEEANETLVTFMDKNDMLLICVVLDNKNSTPCKDTLKAVNYCYEKYTRSSIDAAAQQIAESEAAAQQASKTETTSSEEEAIRGGDQPNIAAKDNSGTSSSPEDTFSKLTNYIIAHPLILLAAGAGLVVLLSLILVWLVSSSERRH